MCECKRIIRLIPLLTLFLLASCGDSPISKEIKQQTETPDENQKVFQVESVLKLSSGGQNIKVYWREHVSPVLYKPMKMLFIVLDDKGRPTKINHKVEAVMWMPNHGHGSADVTVTEISPGVYEATNFIFTMKGLWDIHFYFVDDKDEVVSETKWSYTI